MEFRTEKEILLEMVQDAVDRGLITDVGSSIVSSIENGENTDNQYVLDLATHAYLLSKLEDKTKEIYNNMDVATATGTGLDYLGELVNVYRYTAQPSKIDITVERTGDSGSDITVPAGTNVVLNPVFADTSIVSYTTDEAVQIPAGVTSATIVASSNITGSMSRIPSGAVTGLTGFTTTFYVDSSESTGGRDIESDDDYRKRIKTWQLQTMVGTKQCITNYLEEHEAVSEYRLIPKWDGIGTLKIVVDCLPSQLSTVRQGVQDNCMLYTDEEVVCVLPDVEYIDYLEFNAYIKDENTSTLKTGDIQNLVVGQSRVWLEGGTSRSGTNYKGLTIGEEFEPSKLVSFLLSEIPEVDNIWCSQQKVVEPTSKDYKLRFKTIGVNMEWSSTINSSYPTT